MKSNKDKFKFKIVDDFLPKEALDILDNDDFDCSEKLEIKAGNPNDTIDKSLERIRKAIEESKAEKKMYSFRLKVRTVNALKARAAAIGVPYQTYVNALLDKEAFGTV